MMHEQSPLAIMPKDRRSWAVAAVFGESARLALLHAHLSERIGPTDNLVYLGNLVGRGTDTTGTIEEVLLFRRWLMARQVGVETDAAGAIVYLRGCQEEMWHKLLQLQFAPNPCEIVEWMLDQGLAQSSLATAVRSQIADRPPNVVRSHYHNGQTGCGRQCARPMATISCSPG